MNPTVSVIIPVYNDPEGLCTTLDSVCEQTAGCGKYEIIIIDNNSTDNTSSVAQEFAKKHSNINLVFERNVQSSYAARNRGIQHSDGEIIAFIDADMIAPSNYIETVIRQMKNNKTQYAGIDVDMFIPNNISTISSKYAKNRGFNIKKSIEESNYAPTCCLVVNKDLIGSVGKFDERMISKGDVEFGRRVAAEGFSQKYIDDITLHHPARTTLDSLIRRRARIGRGTIQFKHYHPERSWGYNSLISVENLCPMFFHTFYKKNKRFYNQSTIILVYLLLWVLTLAETYGKIYQSISLRRDSNS